jgi:hypothetical protein
MTREPDFRELVGEEGAPEELERLRRVHELLVAAEPPPDVSRRLGRAPRLRPWLAVLPRPRMQAALGLAAAAAVALGFGIGYGVRDGGGFSTQAARPMHGVGRLASASASIEIGKLDAGGNWPLRMVVRGLPQLPRDGWYELYLTKNGKPEATCGTFRVSGRVTRVRLNAPYDFGEYDGWVVTSHVPGRHDRVLLTT